MSMWTLSAALISAIIVWAWLVRFLLHRPWLADGDPGFSSDLEALDKPPKKVGLYVFLAVVTSLFALFFSAYAMRMDPRHGGDWFSISKPWILWLNTVLLINSSVAMQHATNLSRAMNRTGLVRALLTGGITAMLFILGQLLAWEQLHDSVHYQVSNPALGFFYLLTAVHAIHLLGGLYVWGRLLLTRPGAHLDERSQLSIELCTTYWHYLLGLWLVMFVLFLTT